MKNKTVKAFCAVAALLMLLGVLAFGASASREVTEGMYTYYISQTGKCIITKGDPALSGDLVIPDELGGVPVREIGKSAFLSNKNITSITFPETVTEIAGSAFAGCDSLTEVIIPDTVTILGDGAFSGCDKLVSVSTGNGISEIGERTFHWCNALKTVNIGNNVKTIGEEAFSESKALNNIVIPDNVTEIGRYAFSGCSGLSSVAIGKGVKTIRYRTFKDCYSLGEFVVPDTIEVIEKEAFRNNSITKLIIGKGVMDIGDAFISCDSLEAVVFDEENPYFSSDSEGAVFSKDKTILYSFPQANKSENYVIPDGVKTIASKAFYWIPSLKHITMPDTVTEIGDEVFANCGLSDTLELSENLLTIGEKAFERCNSLTTVVIPDSVKTIGGKAFTYCDNLRNVTLGNGLETIQYDAFSWSKKIQSIVIPDSVKYIGSYAFDQCIALTEISIGKNVEFIGEEAFKDCYKAELKSFPIAVKEIGDSAFEDCTKITNVNFGNSLEKVGEKAFFGCNLETVIIPASIKEIGYYAFGHCDDYYYCGSQDDWDKVKFGKSNQSDYNFIEHIAKLNYAPADFGTVSVDDITINYKSTAKLSPTANISQNYNYKLTYKSLDPSVATVDENGNVTAIKTGTATITCRVVDENGYSASDTCTVTVKYSILQWIINILLLGFLWY